MKFILRQLVLETTRKCNLNCDHCMRGEKQDINLSKEYVDMIFDNKEIKGIKSICFSGGEPTLNPNIIIYAIDKIINNKLDVGELIMVTNGQKVDLELIEAFNKYNEYRNKRIRDILNNIKINDVRREKIIKENTDNHVFIVFSVDQFHPKVPNDVKRAYLKNAKGLKISLTNMMEAEDIYKTGFANIGKEFKYSLLPLRYFKESDYYEVLDNLYLTATGYLTSEGMGQYSDMDTINVGHISEVSIREILAKYGTAVFNTKPIVSDSKVLKRKI